MLYQIQTRSCQKQLLLVKEGDSGHSNESRAEASADSRALSWRRVAQCMKRSVVGVGWNCWVMRVSEYLLKVLSQGYCLLMINERPYSILLSASETRNESSRLS